MLEVNEKRMWKGVEDDIKSRKEEKLVKMVGMIAVIGEKQYTRVVALLNIKRKEIKTLVHLRACINSVGEILRTGKEAQLPRKSNWMTWKVQQDHIWE